MRSVSVRINSEQSSKNVFHMNLEVLRIAAGGGEFSFVFDLLVDPGVKTSDVIRSRETNRALTRISPEILKGGTAIHTGTGLRSTNGEEGTEEGGCELEEVGGVG